MDGEDQAEPMTVEYGTRNHCAVFDETARFEGSIQGNEYSGEVLFEGEGGGSFLLKRKYEKRGGEAETPIDISMLQGCWQNSSNEEFYVEGHELITQFTSFEIEENDGGFIMNGWLLEKNSKRLEWKKKDQIITWNHLHNISPDDVKEMKCQKWKDSVIASKGSLVSTNPSSKVKGSIFCGLCSKTKRVKCIRKKNKKYDYFVKAYWRMIFMR